MSLHSRACDPRTHLTSQDDALTGQFKDPGDFEASLINLAHFPSTSRTGVSGVSPPRRRANVSTPFSVHRPSTARSA